MIRHPAPGFSWWPGHRGRRAAEDAALFCPTGRPRRGPCSLALTRRWNPPLPDPRRTHRLPQDPVIMTRLPRTPTVALRWLMCGVPRPLSSGLFVLGSAERQFQSRPADSGSRTFNRGLVQYCTKWYSMGVRRVFQTRTFIRWMRKTGLPEDALCDAVAEMT